MAATPPPATDVNAADNARVGRWSRWLLAPLLVLLLLAAAVPAGLWFLAETATGRAFVARQVAGVPFDSGMQFEVGRIDGSLLSRFTLVDTRVHDLDGLLVSIPEAEVDWEPITLFGRRVSINQLTIPEIRILRMWKLNPRDPDKPILPDFDIRVDRFTAPRIILEEPLLGRQEIVTAAGRMDIRAGRLLLDTQASSQSGDRLLMLLDAEPDGNRFDLSLDMRSPAEGLLATASGLKKPITLVASGAGSWSVWRGRLEANIADDPLAVLAIRADDGRFRATGELTPGELAPESVRALIEPAIALDATASRTNGAFDLRFVAATPAFALTGGGKFDATDNRFIDTRADLLVRQPEKLNPALSATGLMAAITANGPLKAPDIGWTVRAQQLRYAAADGPMGVNGLLAEGRVTTGPLTIPFSATVASSVGLPPEMQALLARPA